MTTVTVEDSDEMIIDRMGDCYAVPVEHMDLLSHRVRCRKLEIFHYDDEVSFTPNDYGEEEEQELSYGLYSEDRTDDVDRTVHLVDDLDCLIRRIEQMQLVIRQRQQDQQVELLDVSTNQLQEEETPKEPSTPDLSNFQYKQCQEPPVVETQLMTLKRELEEEMKVDAEPNPLSCDELVAVSHLQKAHHQSQCRIDEVICNYSVLRELLRELNNQVLLLTPQLEELNSTADECHDWTKLNALEMPVCKERYQHLLKTKLSKSEAQRLINAHTCRLVRINKKFLTRRQLHFELREFTLEINEIHGYADDLYMDIVRRFDSIEQDMEKKASHSSIRSKVMKDMIENH